MQWSDVLVEIPTNVSQDPVTGTYYMEIVVHGGPERRDACEDCWKPIPQYVDFRRGLVSPESDGDTGGNFAKTRKTWLATAEGPKQGIEHMQKVVCVPCYREAFQRVYPGAELPELSEVTFR